MTQERISLLDAGLGAFDTGENVHYSPGFGGNRYSMVNIEGESVEKKNVFNVILWFKPVMSFCHTNQCFDFTKITREIKVKRTAREVNL